MVLHPILSQACISSFALTFQQSDLHIRDGLSIDLQPLLLAQLPGQIWSRLTTRSYCSACSHQLVNTRPIQPPLHQQQLRSFWSFVLPHRALLNTARKSVSRLCSELELGSRDVPPVQLYPYFYPNFYNNKKEHKIPKAKNII
ncbi:hypothetical protein PHYBLDRAFT_174348 [Phycomyces blakesleeanus NRRL 1555(-)]|uniref:Uncharacterized protein n=1 Tax=Phycomyces blakesleeanus (strain ATCC 8743b / DSM 1359 / FGSC 10004 / NBRC 33097 / NRRL 1555) TaxID=763407 RepID=A0A167K565_PHYB8|nr:hypothetical protein PHYBLDRAFT_174348 [Phycomyces blakesleeanus NRRL 1555(-)]OAD67307.1 hypothetical protein PHYBLDRAFT_174348 [Phycomyces blakesleeanus NRRL 1555(-)]|eukprot:XP_018285347.1 hypothetical protein PHYBLDRAFT_174348 [Phycomyces blakesleeanus NRRL 1555(-)]